jgi:gliding motility-associated-like protein
MNAIKLLLVGLFSVFAWISNAQLVLNGPNNDQSNPLNCSAINPVTLNFSDGVGNYLPNTNDTLILCPDLTQGTKVSIAFAVNIGYTFDINPTDTLYIFDGPNTTAPLLGAYNSGTNPTGFFVQGSFENNPTGCLTLVFVSDGVAEGGGWDAHVACDNPPQPYFPHIEAYKNGIGLNALNPLDTGYVDICFGDSILFVAKPLFPYSLESVGSGYSQTVDNCVYDWTISGGGGQFTNDSIWFTPTQRGGYFVDLRMTDIFPLIERITCKVRVSQLPNFNGTGPVDSQICINELDYLIGGVTPTDTVGVEIPEGDFLFGGSFAGLTALPDGSGSQYSTSITITDFADTSTFQNASDLEQICLDIEHSYIGDIEIALTCPNGQMISLMNAYNQTPIGWNELVPGGCGNSISTALGNDTDIDGGAPGSPVWSYCFSEVNATLGTICAENAAGNIILNDYGIPSINPNGVFQPDGALSGLIGCPLNGDWTITVQDNQGIDDGYIFQWGLYFNSDLFPNSESYQNYINTEYWMANPSIISGMNDTVVTILPPGPGSYNYTYVVEDNFGCVYDTTVNVIVKQPINLNLPSAICQLTYTSTLSTGTNDGQWSFYNSAATPTFQADNVNTTFTFPTPGIYHLVYSDTSCTNKDTAIVNVVPAPPFGFVSDFFNCPFETEHLIFKDSAQVSEFHWGLVIPAQDTLFQADLFQGTYTASYVTALGCTNDTTFTITTQPETNLFDYPDVCEDSIGLVLNVGYPNGNWSVLSAPGTNPVVFSNQDSLQTSVNVTDFGTYTFTFTESSCLDTDTVTIKFIPYPWFSIDDGITCSGDPYVFSSYDLGFIDSYVWNTGETGPTITAYNQGYYLLTGTNECGVYQDSAYLIADVCVIDFPNVFTPDDDLQNPVFTSLTQPNGFKTFKCQIFNRWGDLMHEYDTVNGSWDGKTNGENASEGVYFYSVVAQTVNGREITKQGFFHLIRK